MVFELVDESFKCFDGWFMCCLSIGYALSLQNMVNLLLSFISSGSSWVLVVSNVFHLYLFFVI